MRLPHRDHGLKDRIPSLGFQHYFIREHAAIPTDVLERLGEISFFISQPITGVPRDVQFSVGIIRQTVASGFIMRTAAFNRGIVLSDMKIDSPWPQFVVHCLQSCLQLAIVLPVKPGRKNGVLGSVIAQRIEKRMRHVSLEAECLGPADQFQELYHSSPTVHPSPTNLAFSRQTFALALSDVAAFPEGCGDLLRRFGVIGPSLCIGGRVYPDHSVRSYPKVL